jgi:ABC-type nickel/cobalt efflux system permease component RcnA
MKLFSAMLLLGSGLCSVLAQQVAIRDDPATDSKPSKAMSMATDHNNRSKASSSQVHCCCSRDKISGV